MQRSPPDSLSLVITCDPSKLSCRHVLTAASYLFREWYHPDKLCYIAVTNICVLCHFYSHNCLFQYVLSNLIDGTLRKSFIGFRSIRLCIIMLLWPGAGCLMVHCLVFKDVTQLLLSSIKSVIYTQHGDNILTASLPCLQQSFPSFKSSPAARNGSVESSTQFCCSKISFKLLHSVKTNDLFF